MAYITINEVDKTSTTAPSAVSRNTVFVPINSSDGPSDKPVLCTSYEQFLQVFGTDPNAQSAQMTSWEYAANLLLHRIPVLVRRITHKLSEDGNNLSPLAGVGLAHGIVDGPNPEEIANTTETEAVWQDGQKLQFSKNAYDSLDVNVVVNADGSKIGAELTDSMNVEAAVPAEYYIPNKSRVVTIKNEDNAADSILEVPMDPDREYKVLNNAGVDITKEEGVIIDGVIRLAYNQSAKLTVSDDEPASFASFGNFSGTAMAARYLISSTENAAYLVDVYIQRPLEYEDGELVINITLPRKEDAESIEADPTKMTLVNNSGRVNLFNVDYRYAGVNGNKISVGLHTVEYDGIYLEVYNNTQRLEQIKLVNLRYVDEDGLWAAYNFEDHAEVIWALLLQNFGVEWKDLKAAATQLGRTDLTLDSKDEAGQPMFAISPLESTYVTVELNPSIPVDNETFKGVVASVASLTRQTRFMLTGGSNPTDDCVATEVPKAYYRLRDKYLYNIKFLTNGAYVDRIIYPSTILQKPRKEKRDIETAMLLCAQSRGDCLAFLDIPLAVDRDSALEYFAYIASSYGTAYAPWVKKQLDTGNVKWCPPSFIALETIAKSIEAGNPVYAPPAGVNRGVVTGVKDLSFEIPADYIDYWADNYTQFVNPIVYIEGYGYSIFGQKTLYNVAAQGDNSMGSALQYLNTRLVANEIKKKIFECCVELTFEQNNLHTWLKFTTKMNELLEVLKSNNAITYYECLMDESTMTDYDIRTNHIVGKVRVAIGTTAEKFDIDFEMIPNSVKYANIDYNEANLTY